MKMVLPAWICPGPVSLCQLLRLVALYGCGRCPETAVVTASCGCPLGCLEDLRIALRITWTPDEKSQSEQALAGTLQF